MNIIDTRDLYKRQQELQSELETLQDAVSEAQEAYETAASDWRESTDEQTDETVAIMDAASDDLEAAREALEDWQSEYQEELDELNALEFEVGDEWMHGETLIPADGFADYARDLAEDLHGNAIRDAAWPFDHIDWEAATDDLKSDYSEVEYQGTTYLFRS